MGKDTEMEKKTGMAEEENAMEEAREEEGTGDAADYMKIPLSKGYSFEGEKVAEVDLTGLEDLTGSDMITIVRMMKRRGNTDASPELTMEFAFFAAMQATGRPLEFFYGLNMKDSMKVKSRVNYFLMF